MADETTAGPAPAGPPPTPELDRQSQAIKDGAHKIGENGAWLREQERLLAEFRQLASLPCPSGKQQHDSKKAARGQALSLRACRADPARTNAYFCNMCGSWHVGRR